MRVTNKRMKKRMIKRKGRKVKNNWMITVINKLIKKFKLSKKKIKMINKLKKKHKKTKTNKIYKILYKFKRK